MGAAFLRIWLKEEVTPWDISQNIKWTEKNADLAAVSSRRTELNTSRKMWEEIISQANPGSFRDTVSILLAHDRMPCKLLTFRLIIRIGYWNIQQCHHITEYSLLKSMLVELTNKRNCQLVARLYPTLQKRNCICNCQTRIRLKHMFHERLSNREMWKICIWRWGWHIFYYI